MNRVFKKVYEYKTKRDNLVGGVEENIRQAEAEIRDANVALTEAQNSGTYEDYKSAAGALEDARSKKEMYNKRLDYVRSIPIITDEEARILDKEIRKYVADEERKKLAQAQEIIRPLQKQYDDLSGTVKEANEALRVLHTELLHENSNPVVNAVMYFGHMHKVLNILNADLPESN